MADIPTFTSPTPRRPLSTVLLVVISLVAGMLGAVLLLWFVPAIRTTRIPPGTQSVIVEQPGQVVVEESARIRDLRDQNLRLVGSIAKASGTLTVGGATMYPTSSSSGSAVIVTADGWFATSAHTALAVGDHLVVGRRSYRVAKVLTDPASPLLLGKLEEGVFTPTVFSDPTNRYPGLTVFVLTAAGDTVKTSLTSESVFLPGHQAPVLASDVLSLGLDVTVDTASLPAGTPVFGLDGFLVGIVEQSSQGSVIVPSEVVASALRSVVKSGSVVRPTLGLMYIFDEGDGTPTNPHAAVVYDGRGGGAEPKGPAAGSGLTADDRIIALDGEALAAPQGLFSELQNYQPGTKLTVSYQRQGRTQATTVTVGSLRSETEN